MTTEERIQVADGVTLRVLVRESLVDSNQETQFLLVHGLASNARLWDGVGGELAALGHSSAAVDLRGHGPLGPSHAIAGDAGFGFDAVTDDLVAVTKWLGWDRPVAAGQSWGGNVVVELAARHPEVVRGIACVDGGTIELSNAFADFESCATALHPPALAGTPRARIDAWLRKAHSDWPESGIAGQLANFEVRGDDTISAWLTRDRHLAILRHLYEHRPSTRWSELAGTPTLFVTAENDSSPFPKREQIALASSTLQRMRATWMQGDHDLHAQFPREVAEILHAAAIDGFFA